MSTPALPSFRPAPLLPFSICAAAALALASCQEKKPAPPAGAEPEPPSTVEPAAAKPASKPVDVKTEESPASPKPAGGEDKPVAKPKTGATDGKPKSTALATFGGGCFWCTEAVMERLEGVVDVRSGYMGGTVKNPTYEQVCEKDTGHVEVIQVKYDPENISFDDLLDVFWQAHDPTSWDQQGADSGPQYRSVIFTHTPEQKAQAENSKKKLDETGLLSGPIVTEIRAADTFWEAEAEHQDFYKNNPNNGYCRAVISPKLKKLGLEK